MAGTIDRKGKQKMVYDSEDDELPETPPRIIRALVVDNNDHIRKIHERRLKRLGVETRSAKTGKKVIKIICVEEIYDLILIGRNLRDVDGLKVAKMLRDMEYPTWIAGVTHPFTEVQREEFYDAGVDLYFDNEMPLKAKTLRFIVETTPCPETWKHRNYYQSYLLRGPPYGPGSSSSSKNVSEED